MKAHFGPDMEGMERMVRQVLCEELSWDEVWQWDRYFRLYIRAIACWGLLQAEVEKMLRVIDEMTRLSEVFH